MLMQATFTPDLPLRSALEAGRPYFCLGIPSAWWHLRVSTGPDQLSQRIRLWIAEPVPHGCDKILGEVNQVLSFGERPTLKELAHRLLVDLETDWRARSVARFKAPEPTREPPTNDLLVRKHEAMERCIIDDILGHLKKLGIVGHPEAHVRLSPNRFGYDMVAILREGPMVDREGEAVLGVATGFYVPNTLIAEATNTLVQRLLEDVARRAQVFRVESGALTGTPSVSFTDYVAFTRTTACNPGAGQCRTDNIAYLALGLASEAGEVAGKIKKSIRGDDPAPNLLNLVDELGDVLWYVVRLAEDLGVNPAWLMHRNKAKLEDRAARQTLKGSGDHR